MGAANTAATEALAACGSTLAVGMEHTRSKTITRDEIAMFGEVSGDMNPVHFDDEYASATPFGGVIAHGMIAAGLISAVLGQDLPGPGTVYLGQTLKFRAPVRPGDTVVARVRVADVCREKGRVTLDCDCRVGDTVVVEGQATVLPPKRRRLQQAA